MDEETKYPTTCASCGYDLTDGIIIWFDEPVRYSNVLNADGTIGEDWSSGEIGDGEGENREVLCPSCGNIVETIEEQEARLAPRLFEALTALFSDEDGDINGGDFVQAVGLAIRPETHETGIADLLAMLDTDEDDLRDCPLCGRFGYRDSTALCPTCGEIHVCPECETVWADSAYGGVCPQCDWSA